METRVVENKSLLQGNNDFETGILTVAAGATIPRGAFLARGTDEKFFAITDLETENPVAVNPVEIKNTGAASADIPFRALISGSVRFDMLSVNNQPITAAQGDLLRQFAGIIPKRVTDLSWTRQGGI